MANEQLKLSHAVGYRGFCKINETLLLCTGGNINLTQEPIMGSGVWGAGYMNAAPVAFAWNYLNLQGSSNFELTAGGASDDYPDVGGVWKALRYFALYDRANIDGTQITMLPDGKNGFNGKAWCTQVSFDASEGAALTGTFNFKGDPSQNGFVAGSEEDNSAYGSNSVQANKIAGATLVPYWATKVTATSGVELKDIISWNVSYNADIQMLKLCNRDEKAPLKADYVVLGELSADGSYTVFKIANEFDPKKYHTLREDLTFHIYDAQIVLPQVILNSASTSMATGSNYISSEFSFNALGDGQNPIFNMSEEGLANNFNEKTQAAQPSSPDTTD